MSIVIRGGSSGNLQEVSSAGEAKVVLSSNSSLPLPSGAAQDGADATGVSPPSGATGIRGWLSGIYNKLSGTLPVSGTFFQATQPVSMSAVAVGGATSALQTTGNSSLSTIATNVATSANQASELAQLTAIAANTGASATDFIVNGSITGAGQTVSVTGQGVYTVTISLTGTFVATLVFEGQLGDGNWIGLPASIIASTLPWQAVASSSTNGAYVVTCGGFQSIRVRCTSYTSGTVNVGLEGSLSQMTVITVNPQAHHFNYINTNSTTVIKTGAGRLHSINTNANNNSGTLSAWDNTAGNGTQILGITNISGGGVLNHTGALDIAFNNGLTIVTAGGWTGTVVWD